jgi:hypothetical protein
MHTASSKCDMHVGLQVNIGLRPAGDRHGGGLVASTRSAGEEDLVEVMTRGLSLPGAYVVRCRHVEWIM